MAGCERVICEAASLVDGGRGVRFDLARGEGLTTGFAIRFHGTVHAYVNSCPHRGVELDWQPGEFFEDGRLYLTCSTHGALFEPATGLCVDGPCRGARLKRLGVEERQGIIHLKDDSCGPPAVAGSPPTS